MARRRPTQRKGGPARGRKKLARGGVARGRTRRKMQQGGHTHQLPGHQHFIPTTEPGGGTLGQNHSGYPYATSISGVVDVGAIGANYGPTGTWFDPNMASAYTGWNINETQQAGAHSGHTGPRKGPRPMKKGGRVRNRMKKGGRVRNRMQRGGRVRNRMQTGGNVGGRSGNIIKMGNKQFRCPGGGMTVTADCVEIYKPNLQG
jgi:hypothetical protein